MTTSEIEILLEKFYEGDTSLREEKFLRDFFSGQEVPAHLEHHRAFFSYFKNARQQELTDKEFEQRLTARLLNEPKRENVIRMFPARKRLLFLTSMAASVLLLIGLYFTFQNEVFKPSLKTAENASAELALAEASEALMIISDNLNYGLNQVSHLDKVDHALKSLECFNKFYQCETMIIHPDVLLKPSNKTKLP